LIEAILAMIVLAFVGKTVEPVWSTVEFARFMAIVVGTSGFLAAVTNYILLTFLPAKYGLFGFV
jgi:hypothetical protein